MPAPTETHCLDSQNLRSSLRHFSRAACQSSTPLLGVESPVVIMVKKGQLPAVSTQQHPRSTALTPATFHLINYTCSAFNPTASFLSSSKKFSSTPEKYLGQLRRQSRGHAQQFAKLCNILVFILAQELLKKRHQAQHRVISATFCIKSRLSTLSNWSFSLSQEDNL